MHLILVMVLFCKLITCLFVCLFSYSPVPNAYFAKFVKNKETQEDCFLNTVSQEDTPIQQEEHVSSECTDEELMLALSQTEELSATVTNTSHGDSCEQISEESQSVNSLPSDTQHAPESNNASQSGGKENNLGSVPGESTSLVYGEMNMELSSQAASDEQAEERSGTGLPAETCSGTSHSGEQDSSSDSADHANIASVPEQQTWISCTVGLN